MGAVETAELYSEKAFFPIDGRFKPGHIVLDRFDLNDYLGISGNKAT